ncbi:hypothetical protein ACFFKU_06375 [Kineococcus gynurae]|uniref:Serine/threonine-protein kinase RsbW n=1 Tax=Kineococcus gynurae TaxID=452979 RepID=A0ABV5LX76_9ACTN
MSSHEAPGNPGLLAAGPISDRVSASPPDAADLVELKVPADPAYLTVVRTASAGLAARLDLTLDEIEDLRIAVDEACTLLLDGSDSTSELTATFRLGADTLEVEVRGPARELPERSSFAWAVLEALVGEVFTGTSAQGAWIVLRHHRESALSDLVGPG